MYLIHRQFDNFPQIEYWGPNHKQDMWCFGPRVLHNIDQEKTFWLEGNQHFLEKWLGKILEQMATLELKKKEKDSYSSNNVRKAKNQGLNIVCQNLIGRFHWIQKFFEFLLINLILNKLYRPWNHIIISSGCYSLRKLKFEFGS